MEISSCLYVPVVMPLIDPQKDGRINNIHFCAGRSNNVSQRKEGDLTYAQFPISFANIFRGIVLGSSFSFPSSIRLHVGKNKAKRSALT